MKSESQNRDRGVRAADEVVAVDIMDLYEKIRRESLIWSAAAAEEDDATRPVSPVLARFSIGTNDFPEEAISSSDASFLVSMTSKVQGILSSPLPEAKDELTAIIEMSRRYLYGLVNVYLVWMAWFLACDRRFNPDAPIAFDAARSLDVDAAELPQRLNCLTRSAAFLSPILKEKFPGETFAGELRILQLVAVMYFDMMETVFGLPSVGKCRIGFERLMQAFGTEAAVGLVPNFLRRHRTMQKEICDAKGASRPADDQTLVTLLREQKRQFGAIEAKVDAVKADVAQGTKSVAKLGWQLKEEQALRKATIGGFIRLFRPGQPTPTREKAAAALLPPERYACLSRIEEPHRSQIKAVIDYTWKERPVVFKSKSRSVYTLSDAVGDVWSENEAKWSKVPGTFATEEDLRSACYHIAGKADGGVSFNFRR